MKPRTFSFWALLTCCLFLSKDIALAQYFAPHSLAAQSFYVTVVSGAAPFAAAGNYRLFTSPLGNDFVALGDVEGGLNWGTYTYTQTGTNSGVAVLVDAQSGLQASLAWLYTSMGGGLLTVSNAGAAAFQTATFASTNYTAVTPPQVYLPTVSNGVFNAWVSGQPGVVYTVQTSPDLVAWSNLTSLGISNLAGVFADTNTAAVSHFYRAGPASVDFAPAAISGDSLNFTVAQGAAPLATNGFFQFLPHGTNAGYDAVAGPVFTSLPGGTYGYSKTVPGAAVISSVDNNNTTNHIGLVFTSPDSGFFYATNISIGGFEAGTFSAASGPSLFLGHYQFLPDNSRAASLIFAADGNPATLSVTDVFTNVWTLTIPADALFDPYAITMTPVLSVDSSGAVLPASAAVLLEPDGIQFSDGVTLSVTTPVSLGPQATLMNCDLDGSHLSLALSTNQGNTYATTLFHFSSVVLTTPASQQLQNLGSIQASLIASFNEEASEAQAFASRVIPPPPPDDYFCDQAKADTDGDAYLAQVFGPEFNVIQQLLSTGKALSAIGLNSYLTQSAVLVNQIFNNDIFPRTAALINAYGGDQQKLPVVCRVGLQIWRQTIQLGINPPAGFQGAFGSLSTLLANAGNNYLSQLTGSHDYSAVSQIPAIARDLQMLGGDNGASGSLLAGLSGALSFQLTMDVTASSVSPDGLDTISIEANGQVQLTATLTNIQGNGTINYLSGDNTFSAPPHVVTFSIAPGQSFMENCTLQLSDCPGDGAPMATLTFSVFGSTSETWDFSAPVGPTVAADLIGITGFLFQKDLTSKGYTFVLPLQNGDAEAINQTITQSGANNGGEQEECALVLTLQHTP